MVNRRLVGAEIVERARGRGAEEKASPCVRDCLEGCQESVTSRCPHGCSGTESCSLEKGNAISPLHDPCCCYGDWCTSGGVGVVTRIVRQLLPRAQDVEPRREVVTMGERRRRSREVVTIYG